MKNHFIHFANGLLLVCFSCAGIWAQGVAQISGTVRDQTGAALPGVEITATQTDTGMNRMTVSNETGSYVLANLALGPYRLEATLPGFRSFVQNGIVLEVNSNPVIHVVLEVGQVTEQIEVQANATLVETRNVGVGQVMENQRILELPLNGRNASDLVTLGGAAVVVGTPSNLRSFAAIPVSSVAGGWGPGTGYLLDGTMHTDVYDNSGLPLPFPDALQEFKTETGGLSARMRQGTIVTTVTKSGTNEFHGTLFEFVRNDLFNARSYFATTHSTLKRNQFGGTLGGPIIKNKLLFFGGYQRTITRSDPADNRAFVPTAAMKAGDWTAFTSPACNTGRQITLRAPFANNRIDPGLYSPAAVKIMSKLPNTDNSCGQIIFGLKNQINEGQAVVRVDYQRSQKNSIFGRTVISTNQTPVPYATSNLLTANPSGFNRQAHTHVLGDTYLWSPNLVLSTRLAVNWQSIDRLNADAFGPKDFGINIYSWVPNYLPLTVTGGFTIGTGANAHGLTANTNYNASEDISYLKGKHQMSFGTSLTHTRSVYYTNVVSPGTFSFTGQETGQGMGDFVLGKVAIFSQGQPIQFPVWKWTTGSYAQDTWNFARRLTLTYGLRWDPHTPQEMKWGNVYTFDYDRFRQGIRSTVYPNAPAGLYYPGDPGFPGKKGFNNQWGRFSPRVGLAWDVQGNGRTSLRASYGIARDYLGLQWYLNASNGAPFGSRFDLPSPVGGLDDPYKAFAGGNPFPAGGKAIFAAGGQFAYGSYDLPMPSISSWNLSLQRQISNGLLISGSYIGSLTIHMLGVDPVNPALYFPGGPCTLNGATYNPCSTTGNTTARRRFTLERPDDGQLLGPVGKFEAGGTQTYQGMLLSIQRRLATGITFDANYTWSHCVGDFDFRPDGSALGADRTYTQWGNRRRDRGNCVGDRRQIMNVTMVAQTPQFSNKALRTGISGWKLSGIYRISTGPYLLLTSGQDRALSSTPNQRPDQILADPYKDRSAAPSSVYLNPAAFALPALGTLGNIGTNSVVGPKIWQFDASLSRVLRAGESRRFEIRAEAYNVTNSFRAQNPSTNLSDANFGKILSSGDPRILQFALKYLF